MVQMTIRIIIFAMLYAILMPHASAIITATDNATVISTDNNSDLIEDASDWTSDYFDLIEDTSDNVNSSQNNNIIEPNEPDQFVDHDIQSNENESWEPTPNIPKQPSFEWYLFIIAILLAQILIKIRK